MDYIVKCDQMTEGWDYDTCYDCKHFVLSLTKKGRNWRCKLNSATAKEKRDFYTIWGTDYLIRRGIIEEKYRYGVAIEYVGKKKRRRKGSNDEQHNT